MTTTVVAPRGTTTELHRAIAIGDGPHVAELIRNTACLECRDPEGYTPFLTACRHAEAESFHRLLDAGADFEATNIRGMSGLFIVASSGVVSLARLLIERGANVNRVASRGLTPLVAAMMSENVALVRMLIAAGADVRHRDADGTSMLRWARRVGTSEMMEMIRHPQKAAETLDGLVNWHELHQAARTGDVELIQSCLAMGVKVEAANEAGLTPLMLASRHGKRAAIQVLLEAGADPYRCALNGLSALMMASNNPTALRPFIAAGIDIDRACDRRGITPLIHAARMGFEDVVAFLMANGADPACADRDGLSAYEHALANGHRRIARAVLRV